MAGEGNSEMRPVSHEDGELDVEIFEEAEDGYGADYGYEPEFGGEFGADYGYGPEFGGEHVYEYDKGFEAAQNAPEEEFEDVQRRVHGPVQRQRPRQVEEETPETFRILPLRSAQNGPWSYRLRQMPIQIEEELPESLRIPSSDIQIGKQIGRGGFSTVHKAFWRGQACAAKVVQTTDVRTIQKEVAILSKLDHPHVIRCIGFSVDSTGDPSRCMILMELMDEDLRHVMNERLENKKSKKLWAFRSRLVPFSEAEAVNILEQIAAGMMYLHSHRIFHGDLKASNILVQHGPNGKMHVKITDFGVSQMVKRDPAENTEEFVRKKRFKGAVGTPAYRAPEVSSSSYTLPALPGNEGRRLQSTRSYVGPEYFDSNLNDANYDANYDDGNYEGRKSNYPYTAKADTYCFAMTCYEILSGHVPFEDVRKPDIPELVLRGTRPKLPKTVDQHLKELIQQCWHEKASKRPSFRSIRSWLVDYSDDVQRRKKTFTCFSLRLSIESV